MTMGSLCRFKSEATPFKLWTCGIIKQLLAFIPYVIWTLPTLCLKEGLLSLQRSCLSILWGKDDVPWIMSSFMLWSILLYDFMFENPHPVFNVTKSLKPGLILKRDCKTSNEKPNISIKESVLIKYLSNINLTILCVTNKTTEIVNFREENM